MNHSPALDHALRDLGTQLAQTIIHQRKHTGIEVTPPTAFAALEAYAQTADTTNLHQQDYKTAKAVLSGAQQSFGYDRSRDQERYSSAWLSHIPSQFQVM